MWFLLAILAGCGGPADPDRVTAASRTFDTTACRAASLPPARPHPGGEPGFLAWGPPAGEVVDLLGIDGEIRGGGPVSAGVLAAWDRSEIAAWERRRAGHVAYTTPLLGADGEGLVGARRIRVVLRPGAARTVAVVPSPNPAITERQATLRRITFTLDEPEDPAAPVTVEGSIDEALRGNWGDDKRNSGRLYRVRVELPRVGGEPPLVERIEVLDDRADFVEATAGRRIVGVDDVLHPAWFVHGGAAVRLPVAVPEGESSLRWADAGVGTVRRDVWLEDGEGGRIHLAGSSRTGGWRPERVALTPWAGREVVLAFTAQGDGIGLFGAPRIVASAGRGPAPNVVLYTIDTLRADHVGAWGNPVPGVTPTLDRLAAEGTAFGFTQSTSPWTKPAIPTLLTGLWPTRHRVGSTSYTDALAPTVPTLQDRFAAAGWRTGSFSASPLGSTLSGLERGFDTAMPPIAWRDRLGPLGHVSADQLADALFAWHDEEPDRPFFAYVHTLEVHAWRRAPYADPPEGWTSYDAAVHDADAGLGRFVAELEARGMADDTLVVVVSDHGESFGDHGVQAHGTSLYQSQIHVPLLFWAGDRIPPQTVTHPVSLADVAPTILDLVGLSPLDADGVSLVPYLRGPVAAPIHDGVPSARLRYVWQPRDPKWFAWTRADGMKGIRVGHGHRVFDLSEDLCEGTSEPYVSVALRDALDAWVAAQEGAAADFDATHGAGPSGPIDADDVRMLRELGYLE